MSDQVPNRPHPTCQIGHYAVTAARREVGDKIGTWLVVTRTHDARGIAPDPVEPRELLAISDSPTVLAEKMRELHAGKRLGPNGRPAPFMQFSPFANVDTGVITVAGETLLELADIVEASEYFQLPASATRSKENLAE